MTIKVGIVGVSGYGGGEILRLVVTHPEFELTYIGGASSAGPASGRPLPRPDEVRRPGDRPLGPGEPAEHRRALPLAADRRIGQRRCRLPASLKVVDIGGDHRFVEGWTYGLAELWPEQIKQPTRIANPGCYPAATLLALAPLVAED